VIDPINIKD
jgi:hypothetical protein